MGDRLATTNMGRKLGGCVPYGGEAGSACNTMWPGPRPTFIPSGILIHPAVCPQQTWAENWRRGSAPWGEWEWVRIKHKVARAEAYLRTKWHLDPSSSLATIDMGRKFGAHRPLFGEERTGSPSNTMSLWPWPTSLPSGVLILPAIWPQHMG